MASDDRPRWAVRAERSGGRALMLTAIKLLHTAVWALFAACILGIFAAAGTGRFGLALVFIGVVMLEVLVLLFNRMRCPLTGVAARYTSARADNFDIYLPLWLARYNTTENKQRTANSGLPAVLLRGGKSVAFVLG